MKPLKFIGMVVFAILMSVNFISCNKEDVEIEITIYDLEESGESRHSSQERLSFAIRSFSKKE